MARSPSPTVVQDVIDDIAREFEITLASIYLPISAERLSMVGVAGYPHPFHEIDVGVGIIGRAAATRQTQYVADVLSDPDYLAARDDVRTEVAAPVVHGDELLARRQLRGHDSNGRSARPRSRWPRWSPSRSRRRSARRGSTMSGATGCTRSNACWG